MTVEHNALTSIHDAAFIAATDPFTATPALVRANLLWVDTGATPPTFKLRNAGNTAWLELATGPAGVDGAPGATGADGEPGLVWRGLWSALTDYVVGDAVYHDVTTSSFICILDDTTHGAPDTNVTHWDLLAPGTPGDTGSPGMVWHGAWDDAVPYVVGDAVESGGSSYIAVTANTNVLPPGAGEWELLAAKGDDGTAGPPVITTEGDLIVGDSGGAPDRLPIGTEGQVLTSVGGTAAWDDAPAGGGGVSPTHATMWHDEAVVITGNAIASVPDTQQRYNSWSYQNAPANGDVFEQTFLLAAGTYVLHVLGLPGSQRGKVDWSVDGVVVAAAQDWYSGSLIYNTIKTATISIATDGLHTLRGTLNGHNGSSSDYQMLLTKYWIAAA